MSDSKKPLKSSTWEATPVTQDVPYKQIRALYDEDTITVYQAYSSSIAIPAVREQSLCASTDFKLGRMTWIKPSWCWMMYRSGYSYKDPRQAHILALKISHHNFKNLLSQASVTHGGRPLSETEKEKSIRVQWDPERTAALGVLPYRSIQIGISGAIKKTWVKDWIVGIEDVTEKARELKRVVEEGIVDEEELRRSGLLPREKLYVSDQELRETLRMDLRDQME